MSQDYQNLKKEIERLAEFLDDISRCNEPLMISVPPTADLCGGRRYVTSNQYIHSVKAVVLQALEGRLNRARRQLRQMRLELE